MLKGIPIKRPGQFLFAKDEDWNPCLVSDQPRRLFEDVASAEGNRGVSGFKGLDDQGLGDVTEVTPRGPKKGQPHVS